MPPSGPAEHTPLLPAPRKSSWHPTLMVAGCLLLVVLGCAYSLLAPFSALSAVPAGHNLQLNSYGDNRKACTTAVKDEDWAALRSGLSKRGALLLASSPGFAKVSSQWIQTTTPLPLAAVRAGAPSDVQAAVRFARDKGLCLTVKSSGHSWDATAVMDNRLLVDVGQLNSVHYDIASQVVSAGAGANMALLTKHARAEGWISALGGCGDVAVGGFLTGGGQGFFHRFLGVGVDSVLSYDVVLASGKLVTATEQHEADLFWALRGGHGPGPNFGLVTAVSWQTKRTAEVLPQVAQVSATVFGRSASSAFSQYYMAYAPSAPRTADLALTDIPGTSPDQQAVNVAGWYFGSVAEAKRDLAGFLQFPGVQNVSAVASNVYEASEASYAAWSSDSPTRVFHAHSGMGAPLDHAAQERLLDVLGRAPLSAFDSTTNGIAVFQTDSPTKNKPLSAYGAYPWRSLPLNFLILLGSSDVSKNDELKEFAAALYAELPQDAIYANYADLSVSRDESLRAMYGPSLPRLRQLKSQYDPDCFFHFPHSLC